MANQEHVLRLKHGINAWNDWIREAESAPDLGGAVLTGEKLWAAVLVDLDMTNANLFQADLSRADLTMANLNGANLREATLTNANFTSANLNSAKLIEADLSGTILRDANLHGADLTGATLYETVFADVDLSHVIGLEACIHWGPSIIDHRTLQKSLPLPLSFLRGVGLPDTLIEYLPSLLNRAIQHYSCFISYSTKDQDFADRLHADLQNKAVRCWFAPHDMPIGGRLLDEIDAAIKQRDKLLLILSEHSIKSDWVEDEVTKAFEEERKRGQTVLFPIRIDDAVMDTNEAWAAKLRARHIGDFSRWKDLDAYRKGFGLVLRDLTVRLSTAEQMGS